MALIEARKRMDVTGLDISEQPDSAYILMYNELPFAIDRYEVDNAGMFHGQCGGVDIVHFNARRATWIVIRRSAAKLATKEEVASAQADLQKLHEELAERLHPDEFRAFSEQRRRALGLGSDRVPGQYV